VKSLRWRLTVWFAISLLSVVVVLMISAHWHLDYELRKEKWERTHPAQPDWILHGSFTDQEVHDILGELARFWLLVSVPLVGLAIASAYFVAHRSTRPIRKINEQLSRLDVKSLSHPLHAPDTDPEVGELVSHFNELLGRLQASFKHLQEYTGQVAHELRTPLQLMRLRIEANASAMDPDLADELQDELARLSNYVEMALTIARAEQGRLELNCEPVELKEFLADILEPFGRLALAEGRQLHWSCPEDAMVKADPNALKQILFNVLSNAMKHGERDIFLRVRARGQCVTLLLGNLPANRSSTRGNGLGIGLRLVQALAGQMQQTHFILRQRRFVWFQLRLPSVKTRTLVSA
jgi:signal transduction histidine kinase